MNTKIDYIKFDMKAKLFLGMFILLAVFPQLAAADFDCIEEGMPYGYKINRSEKLPTSWLTLGDNIIIDEAHHDAIRQEFKDYLKGDRIFFCVQIDGVYITVSNDDEFGPWFEFSGISPKCGKCKLIKTGDKRLTSKAGLKIGQSKADVATLLGINFSDDVVDVIFEETEKSTHGNTLHEQKLKLEFRSNKLIRFWVGDYREGM